MNKKLIAAAIAAAMVAPAAYAQATLYGKFHTSIDKNDNDSYDEDNWEVNSRASRLGVKGSEDLGGGLKAIYQLEVNVNSDGSSSDGQGLLAMAKASRRPITIQLVIINPTKTDSCLYMSYWYAFNTSLTSYLKDRKDENLMPYLLDCVKSYTTLGETCGLLRDIFGEYEEPADY